MDLNLHKLRENYDLSKLEVGDTPDNPIDLFKIWFGDAEKSGMDEPNAMSLATVDELGHPALRIVLLKEIYEEGFVFYTNYLSRKGRNIDANPHVAITFWWPPLQRQVRIEGSISKISESKSDAYFKERPAGSRIGAYVSPQSHKIEDRISLEESYKELESKIEDGFELVRPDYWGGYILDPAYIEFWQGRPNRLHDRIVYELNDEGLWDKYRLAP